MGLIVAFQCIVADQLWPDYEQEGAKSTTLSLVESESLLSTILFSLPSIPDQGHSQIGL